LFEYKFKDGSFSQEYGVFAVFALFMGLYICFAGGVLIFQLYLVVTNTTTREVLDRKKCTYLKGLSYNPFTQGLLGNITQAACPNPDGEYFCMYLGSGKSGRTLRHPACNYSSEMIIMSAAEFYPLQPPIMIFQLLQ
jgi:hypothetical protein